MITQHQNIVADLHSLQDDILELSDTWFTILQWEPIRIVVQFFYKIYLIVVAIPMFYLYMNGPSIGNIGFWSGKSLPDICSTITKVDAHFWTSSSEKMQECEIIVFREYHAFMVGMLSIIYIFILGKMICILLGSIQKSTHQAYHGIVATISQRALSRNDILEERIIIKEGTPSVRRNFKRSLSKEHTDISPQTSKERINIAFELLDKSGI